MYVFLASLFRFVELLADALLGIRETAAFKTNMNRSERGQTDQVQVDLILPSLQLEEIMKGGMNGSNKN